MIMPNPMGNFNDLKKSGCSSNNFDSTDEVDEFFNKIKNFIKRILKIGRKRND